MHNENILHLDRLSLPDLGKFSMILSETLTTDQRAYLNTTFPDMMATMGAFSTNHPPTVSGAPVPQTVYNDMVNLIKAGKKIMAIKTMRNETGVSLVEAKEYCDRTEKEINAKR